MSQPIEVYFAGLCDPARMMAYGWAVVRQDTGELVADGKACLPTPTNSGAVAAYMGLYLALRHVRTFRQRHPYDVARPAKAWPGVLVRGDDVPVCSQIRGEWAIESPEVDRLCKGHKACLELLTGPLAPYFVECVPPSQNLLARRKAEEAYEAGTGRKYEGCNEQHSATSSTSANPARSGAVAAPHEGSARR